MKNLAQMLFTTELMSEVFKALAENRTVLDLEYARHDGKASLLRLELRVTHTSALRLPASRKPMAKARFQERVLALNGRDIQREIQRVRPGRKAAPDDAER